MHITHTQVGTITLLIESMMKCKKLKSDEKLIIKNKKSHVQLHNYYTYL